MIQLLHPYMTTGKTIALARWIFVGKVMSLLFNILFMTCEESNIYKYIIWQSFSYTLMLGMHKENDIKDIKASASAKSLQSCQTLCESMDHSLPGSSVNGILQARILESPGA